MPDRTYTVYKHTAPNGKVYVGITAQTNVNRRWQNGRGYRAQELFSRAIAKYGWKNIKHEILYTGLTKEEAETKEIELIAKHKSNNPLYGYNIENGGNCTGTHSEETKKKISESQRGEKNHMYGKHSWSYGKKQSAEAIEKNRLGHLGQQSYWKGKHLPKKAIEKLRKPKSEEHKRKLSESKSKCVVCIETGTIYKSMKQAAEELGINRGTISNVCLGKTKTAGGLHWEFAEVV